MPRVCILTPSSHGLLLATSSCPPPPSHFLVLREEPTSPRFTGVIVQVCAHGRLGAKVKCLQEQGKLRVDPRTESEEPHATEQ